MLHADGPCPFQHTETSLEQPKNNNYRDDVSKSCKETTSIRKKNFKLYIASTAFNVSISVIIMINIHSIIRLDHFITFRKSSIVNKILLNKMRVSVPRDEINIKQHQTG